MADGQIGDAAPEWRAAGWSTDDDRDTGRYGLFRRDAVKPSMTFATRQEAEDEAARLNQPIASRPILAVVSGHAAAGKTTLAHALARELGCPAICRDEIKEGMVHAVRAAGGDFEPGVGDVLSIRTLHAFSDVLRVLASANVSVVAEAAFQDHLWRYVLEPVVDLVELRIVHCTVDAVLAWERAKTRRGAVATRAAHAVPEHVTDVDTWKRSLRSFTPIALPAPSLQVDTTDGYTPSLADVAAFVNAAAERAG